MNYRFQYYDTETGAEFLPYDNSQVPTHGAGHHHRHVWVDGEESVTGIDFVDLESHLSRFETELTDHERT